MLRQYLGVHLQLRWVLSRRKDLTNDGSFYRTLWHRSLVITLGVDRTKGDRDLERSVAGRLKRARRNRRLTLVSLFVAEACTSETGLLTLRHNCAVFDAGGILRVLTEQQAASRSAIQHDAANAVEFLLETVR